MKKAWETQEAGRAQKALQSREKFLESLQPKADERPPSACEEPANAVSSDDGHQQLQPTPTARKTSSSVASRKGSTPKEMTSPPVPVDEPLLNEPPAVKSNSVLPRLDVEPFTG